MPLTYLYYTISFSRGIGVQRGPAKGRAPWTKQENKQNIGKKQSKTKSRGFTGWEGPSQESQNVVVQRLLLTQWTDKVDDVVKQKMRCRPSHLKMLTGGGISMHSGGSGCVFGHIYVYIYTYTYTYMSHIYIIIYKCIYVYITFIHPYIHTFIHRI